MTKAAIKAWLKALGRNKVWLAQEIGVSVNTINGWLYGSRPIPARSELQVAQLMQQHPASTPAPAPAPASELPENVLVLTASPSEFAAWNTAALASGQLVTEWAASVLNDVAASIQP